MPSPPTNDGPHVAPSLASGSDTAEDGDIEMATNFQPGNSVTSADPLQRDVERGGDSLTQEGLRGIRFALPMPEPSVGSISSPLRINWGPGPPSRPSERIPRQIIPVAAQSILRYNRRVRIRSSDSKFTIHPGTKEFVDPQRSNLGDWEPCTHPEGALYFKHPYRVISVITRKYHLHSIFFRKYALMPISTSTKIWTLSLAVPISCLNG
ncbi:hypothetical protein HYDPIDRAFT_109617 [Hydnomerulius pinastri MD-312]|nr:hypothetical protein HYDPIDRAFT_109617 [Hydnomerulius pinastri MD-312]